MRTVSNFVLALAVICAASIIALRPATAQVGSPVILGVQTSVSGCAWPSTYATITNGMAICPLNLSTGPGLAIAVATSTGQGSFVQIGGPSGVFPQSVTAASGTCLTGYSATTGVFTTGPCLASLTKAEVLATGIAATTTLQ